MNYTPPPGDVPVLHEDENLLIINKPSGLLSVPGRGPEKQDCVQSRLIGQGYPEALIVHRLDMETSGLMVFARDAESHRALSRQFETRQISKTYHALIYGHPADDAGDVDLPLRCDWPNRPKQMVDHDQGKKALTHWKLIERLDNGSSLVALYPVTGRSHQLRVHMLAMGHVILGDPLYAAGPALAMADRLCLHASSLAFPSLNDEGDHQYHCIASFLPANIAKSLIPDTLSFL